MNTIIINGLKASRKAYQKVISGGSFYRTPEGMLTGQAANDLIAAKLLSPDPIMVGRLGAVELTCMANYLSIKNNQNEYLRYISGRAEAFWWEKGVIQLMNTTAGFFPLVPEMFERFTLEMVEDLKMVDVLGSWLWQEKLFAKELSNAARVGRADLEPYLHKDPWSKVLEGKKVLVVHPFALSIRQQYQKRHLLFEDKRVLPDFDLQIIQAVQSIADTPTRFNTWFEALDSMKDQLSAADFDIAIIGCGAYGFPLAAHVKRMGKKAVHLGGATQMLFGIIGKRWETKKEHSGIAALINEHWTRPQRQETPEKVEQIEGGCYW